MEINQITYFVALAQTLHFTRAAEACNVSQPALTKAIQKLEEELGGPLFLRERSRTQLTELGQLMLPQLEQALAAVRDAKAQAVSFRTRTHSPLRIGLELSLPTALLSPLFAALSRHAPDFDLWLHQGAQDDLCERMLAGSLDLALLVENSGVPERMHRWTIFSERYVVICPPEHPLLQRHSVTLADLVDERMLLHEDSNCPIRRFVAAAISQSGIRLERQSFASSQEQIFDMVRASVGVSVAGERQSVLTPLPSRPIGDDQDARRVAISVVAGRQLGPTPSLFLKMLRARSWSSAAGAN